MALVLRSKSTQKKLKVHQYYDWGIIKMVNAGGLTLLTLYLQRSSAFYIKQHR